MPEIKLFHFVNNFGAQTKTTIKAATGEKIYFNGAEVNQIVTKIGQYLTINKKGTRWYFIDGNIDLTLGLEAPHFVGDPGEPVFKSGFSNAGLPRAPLSFKKDFSKNIVYLSGNVERATLPAGSGQYIFTIPTLYKPSGTGDFTIHICYVLGPATKDYASVFVDKTTGDILAYSTTALTNPIFCLDGIFWFTD
jgi:hypothetical protein